MNKWVKVLFVLVLMFIIKNKVFAYTFESVENGDGWGANSYVTCGPYYDFNNKIWINNNGSWNYAPSVLFLKFPQNNGQNYYYIWALNTGTSEITESNNKEMPSSYTKPKNKEECPIYIETDESKFNKNPLDKYKGYWIVNLSDLSFKMYSDKSQKGDGEIFKIITENNMLQCSYKLPNNRDIDLFYIDGIDDNGNNYHMIIPDNKGNGGHIGENAILINNNIADAWYDNGIRVDDMCPCIVGNAEAMKSAEITSDSFNYNKTFKNGYGVKACDENGSNTEICAFYSTTLKKIENDYQDAYSCDKTKDEFCHTPYILDADMHIADLKEGCSEIFKTLDVGEKGDKDCVNMCLNFSNDLSDLKKKYKIEDAEAACGLSSRIIGFIANVMKWIKYIAPVLAIILGILDFVKAIAAQNDDDMKKAQGKFVKRLIAAALLFIVPFILEFLLEKFNVGADYCNII